MWKKIKEKFLTKQFLTFGIIGACNTLISQGLYMLFVICHVEVGVASIAGDVLSMVFSYFANMHFTYKQKPTLKGLIVFPLSYLPGTIISALIVILVVNVLGAPEIWAKAISLPITIPLNYVCMSFMVKFMNKKKDDNQV